MKRKGRKTENKGKKIYILTAFYKREWLNNLFLDYYKKLQKKYDWLDIIVVVEKEEEIKLVEKYNFNYVIHNNIWLGERFNVGLAKIKELDNFEGVILLGSDDFVNDAYFDYIYKNKNVDFIGFHDIYFFDVVNNDNTYFSYNTDTTVGAGRYFNIELLKKADFQLWIDQINRGLDGNCWNRIKDKVEISIVTTMEEAGVKITDIKSDVNLTSVVFNKKVDVATFEYIKDIIEIGLKQKQKSKIIFENGKIYKCIFLKDNNIYELEGSTAQALYMKKMINIIN